MSQRLHGKLALVTGATRGIGHAVARRLAAEGAHVIATARDVKGLEALDDEITAAGGAVTLAPLDLQRPDQLEQMCGGLYQRFGRLDILAGCAGVLPALSPLAHTSQKVWGQMMSVNLGANYRLIRALDPALRAAPAGRAFFLTCAAAHDGLPYWAAYAAAKAGLEALVRGWAAELAGTPARANLLDPGPVATPLRAAAFPGEGQETLRQPDDAYLMDTCVMLASPDCDRQGERVTL